MGHIFNKEHPLKVFTAFSGIDFQCQALDRLVQKYPPFSYDLVGWSEIDKYAIQIHNILYPQYADRNFGDIQKVDWEKVPDFDLLTWSSPCFVAGTLVLTDQGYKPIEEVRIGDKVLTHTNSFKSVVNVGKRLYHGNMTKIYGMGTDMIYCTEEHPFYVRRMYRKGHKMERSFHEPEWIKAKNLDQNCYLGYAINQNSSLPNWNGSNADRWGNRVNRLSPLFSKGSFWYLMGRYVGDGWRRLNKTGNSVVICCSYRNESSLINALKDCDFHYHKVVERTVYKYFISMNELVSFVERYGYYAYGKHIDIETLNLPVELLRHFLMGYTESDGCKIGNIYKTCSVSRDVCFGIAQCIAKVYHRPFAIYRVARPNKTKIEGRTVNQRDSYNVVWRQTGSAQDKAFYEDGNIWYPLSKLPIFIDDDIVVYNMSVEDDESYTANGAIVHNCQDISLAGLHLGLAEDSGTRSSLIWHVKEAILAKKPKYVVLENVKNLVGSRYRPYFDHWLELLDGYGYKNFWKVINAADCGVPQSRERVFGVSILRTEDNPDPQFFFPRPIPLTECMLDRLDPKGSIDEKYWISEKAIEYYERVDADKSHNHNFTRKKKRT